MEFREVYFRLDSSYRWGSGQSQEDNQLFVKETRELFVQNGWEVKEPSICGGCDEFIKAKQRLYAHPMDLSGEALTEEIPIIEEILKNNNCQSFKLRKVDIYEILPDYDEEKVLELLNEKAQEIEDSLLSELKTKRKNLFRYFSIFDFASKYKISTISNHIVESSSDPNQRFIRDLFLRLLTEGKIIEGNTRVGKAYRSA